MSKIKRIVRYRPAKATPKKAVPESKPLDIATQQFLSRKGSAIGTLPDDLTFFQSLRMRLSGEEVTEPYRQHAWVYFCVSTIAETVASVPFKLATGDSDKPTILPEEGPIYSLFLNPNPHMTRHQLWEATLTYLGLEGECMWLLERPKGKENSYNILPTEIWPLSGKNFTPIIENNVFVGWKYQEPGKTKPEELSLAQVIQFKYFNPYNYYRGMSPIRAAKMGIDQDWNAAKYNLAFFENSADPGGVLTHEGTSGLTSDQRTAIRENWEDRHKGSSKARRIALLEGGLKYQQTQVSHTDMLFLEGRKYNRDEIFAVYKMPKWEDINYATSVTYDKNFWRKNLIPKINYLMDVLEAKFFKFIAPAIWGMFDLSIVDALQEDFNLKIETAYKMFQMHYPINKINKRLNLGLESVPWGDEVFLPFSMVPISSLMSGGGELPPEETLPKPAEEESAKKPQGKSTLKIDRDKYWNAYVKKILDPNEKVFQSKIKGYIYKLRVDQLARLTAEKSVTKLDASGIEQVLFAQEEWDKKLKALARPLYETIMAMAGKELSDEMGGLFQFNLTDPRILAFLNKKLIKVTDINDTIRIDLRHTLMEGINARETIGELQDRIRTVFNFTSNRSLTIARTETAQTASGTRFIAMQQEGVEYHEWLSARDELVRKPPQSPYNHAIDGTVVRVGDRFPTGGIGLKYPSDAEGEPGSVINCRCVAVFSRPPKE